MLAGDIVKATLSRPIRLTLTAVCIFAISILARMAAGLDLGEIQARDVFVPSLFSLAGAILFTQGFASKTLLSVCCSLATSFPWMIDFVLFVRIAAAESALRIPYPLNELCRSSGRFALLQGASSFAIAAIAGGILALLLRRLDWSTPSFEVRRPVENRRIRNSLAVVYWTLVALFMIAAVTAFAFHVDVLSTICRTLMPTRNP